MKANLAIYWALVLGAPLVACAAADNLSPEVSANPDPVVVGATPISSPKRHRTEPSTSPDKTASFVLELSYAERIIVPRGSDLHVTVTDAVGRKVFTRNAKTKADSPPYLVEVSVKSPASFPLTVDANLVSAIGHRFSERVQVAQLPSQRSKPVEIDLKAH